MPKEGGVFFGWGFRWVGGVGLGLSPCPDGLGLFLSDVVSRFKWAFPGFWGGLNPCQDGLGHFK